MNVLILYLGITLVGYFAGAFLRKKGMAIKGAGLIQTVCIILLVFTMGSRIGADKEIVSSLGTIGVTAFILTMLILACSVASVFAARKLMGFNRIGDMTGKRKSPISDDKTPAADAVVSADFGRQTTAGAAVKPEEEESKGGNRMTYYIVLSVVAGILAGYFILPEGFINASGTVIVVGLCVLLFFVGLDIGTEGTIINSFRQAGWRIMVFPFVVIAGTMIGSIIGALILPVSVKDALCVGSGMGWYSLAPAMLAEYSTEVSAISFMHNVMRELFAILLIPFVAGRIGYIETVSMPGAAAMDVCLPIVEKATRSDIAVYSFISGAVLSIAVPILVSFMMGI